MLTLVCPQCQASYQLPASHFGPAGKKVRCAQCGHVWIAHDDIPAPIDFTSLLTPAEDEPVSETEPLLAAAEPAPVSFSDALAAADQTQAEPPVLVVQREQNTLVKPKLISAKRLDQARAANLQQEKGYQLLKYARWGSLAAVAVLLLLFTAGNPWVVHKWPSLLPVYQQFGFNPLPAASGLQFVNITDDSAPAEEAKPLRIHGEIENLTDQIKAAPMLVLHVTAPNGQTKQFVHNLHDQPIKPHERLAFSIERPHFAEAGWQVKIALN